MLICETSCIASRLLSINYRRSSKCWFSHLSNFLETSKVTKRLANLSAWKVMRIGITASRISLTSILTWRVLPLETKSWQWFCALLVITLASTSSLDWFESIVCCHNGIVLILQSNSFKNFRPDIWYDLLKGFCVWLPIKGNELIQVSR